MIEEKSIVESIEIMDSCVQLRIAMLVTRNGDVISREIHRTCLDISSSVQSHLSAVSDGLVSMGRQPISTKDIDRVMAFHQLMVDFGGSA